MTQKRVVPIDGSTVSHHAIITLAIRLPCSTVVSRSHCQAASGRCSKLRRSVVSSLGHDHAYPGHGLEAAAHIIGTMMGVNGPIQSPDLQFQSRELINNGLQRLFHRRWKSVAITLVGDDRGKLRETFASRLRNEAELGEVGSEFIDQLRTLTD